MSKTLSENITKILTYLGLLPFLLCTVLIFFHIYTLPFLGYTTHIVAIYGLVIATFIAGAHWGQHLMLKQQWSIYLTITSNLNAIFLWSSYLFLSFKHLLIALSISFITSLLIDKKLLASKQIPHGYFRTRCLVTSMILLCFICLNLMLT
jgi:hypothetical protein